MATLSDTSTATSLLAIVASTTTAAISSITSSTSTVSAAISSSTPRPGENENTGECRLLGPFAILVQAALGALALLSLVYKRWRERPQRPVKIWAFDASKQVFGSVLLHLANLLMSMFSAGEITTTIAKAAADTVGVEGKYQPNPCSFYILNLGIDTTIGIPILIIILKILTIGASYTPLANPPESIKSGYYGSPPRYTWWLKQSIIYFIGLLGMKSCVFFLFEILPWIVKVGDWALRWTEGNEAVQITFVMFVFPLVMNAVQYYIIDIFIKKKEEEEKTVDGREDGDEGEQGGLLAGDGNTTHSLDDEARKESIESTKGGVQSRLKEDALDRDEVPGNGESSSPSIAAEREAIQDRPRI
jgi:hypothetical protein